MENDDQEMIEQLEEMELALVDFISEVDLETDPVVVAQSLMMAAFKYLVEHAPGSIDDACSMFLGIGELVLIHQRDIIEGIRPLSATVH